MRKISNKVVKCHIGTDVWCAGKITHNYKGTSKQHFVIYGPNRAEYNVEGFNLHTKFDVCRGRIDQAKLKIYILTSILDNRNNWCFDLECIPTTDKLKVIYSNGTVRNIEFDGVFNNYDTGKAYWRGKIYTKPVAYRFPQ